MNKQILFFAFVFIFTVTFIFQKPVEANWIWERSVIEDPIEVYAPALAAHLRETGQTGSSSSNNANRSTELGSDNPIAAFAPALAAALAEMAVTEPVSGSVVMAENFKDFLTAHTFLDSELTVLEYHDGSLLARRFGRELVRSTDHGISWAYLNAFQQPIKAVYVDASANIFVTTSSGRWEPVGTGEVFKSSDGGLTFRKVLDVGAGVPLNWNITSRDGLMFISEYGYKGNNGNNARRIYRSLDRGETWDIVFEPAPREEWHNHKILITNQGLVYQSIGDGENAKIIHSNDNGDNWDVAVNGIHPTSAVEFETHILWGLDAGENPGIVRYDKNSGEITQALNLPEPFNGSAYGMALSRGVVYAIFLSYEGYSHPASIFYSEDEGNSWQLLGRIEKPSDSLGIGLYNLVLDGRFGYIDIQTPVYRNGTIEQYRGTLRFGLVR